jgi:hypothetical protein
MSRLAFFATAGAGLGAVPAKPTLTHHTTTGQFRITNYDSTLIYNLSVTSGTATRSADIITLSNANSICIVTAKLTKGVNNSPSATAERKAYTFYVESVNSYQHDWINATPGACEGYLNYGTGPNGASGYACLDTGYNCQHTDIINRKNSTPSGYTDSYNEWWKVA